MAESTICPTCGGAASMCSDSGRPASLKERTDLLLRLADAAWRAFDSRRVFEWKANLALWAALGAAAGYLWDRSVPVEARWAMHVLLAVIGGIYIFSWTKGMFRRNYLDYHIALYYWSVAETELRPALQSVEQLETPYKSAYNHHSWDDRAYLTNWSRLSQITFTILLLVLAAISVSVGT